MFATPAFAQTASGGDPMGGLTGMLPLVLIFVIFYFFLIRPQQKRAKEHKALLEAVRRGDQVITGGGIHGKVTKVGEGEEIEVEIAQGVKVKVQRSTLLTVMSKTEPANDS
ncbi:preprotein translocase subunit YajC [Rhodobacteraceae bacterium NNCM2]|nr:preprotein translocase subunit YajC [Coraliihabitans acroporae]